LYTAIPEKFIDTHLKFYDLCKNDIYGININSVIKYLKIKNVKRFYEGLRNKFTSPKDYIIRRRIGKSMKGIKDAEYFITLDTFEKICLTSHSEVSNHVRDYFITLRKFIDYYKTNIHKFIIEGNHPSIYVILVNKNKSLYKIGRTNNLRKRLRSYSTGKEFHPDIKFIILIDDPLHVESCIKSLLKKNSYRENRELFKVDTTLLKGVISICAQAARYVDSENKLNALKNKLDMDGNNLDAYIMYDEWMGDFDEKGNLISAEQVTRKVSKKSSKRSSKKSSRRSSRKSSRRSSRKSSKKTSKKSSRNTLRKASKKSTKKSSKKTSRKNLKKSSRKK